MASEDSDELMPGLLVVHRLSDLSDLDQTPPGQMATTSITSMHLANFSKSYRFEVLN
jgi:hypothetical protein